MSDILITNTININKGTIRDRGLKVNNLVLSQTGSGYQSGTLDIGAGVTVDLPIDELTTAGVWNLQVSEAATGATLQVGPNNGGAILPMDELNETEVASGRIASGAGVKLKAIGGAVKVEFFVAED